MNPRVIRVFLLVGQSNIAGADAIANGDSGFVQQPADKACLMTYAEGPGNENSPEYVSWGSIKGHTVSSAAHPQGFVIGPEVGLCRQLFSPAEPPLAVIKLVGNIRVEENEWLWKEGQTYFTQMIAFTQRRLHDLRRAGWLPNVAGIVWEQGIDDGFNIVRAKAYASHLRGFIGSLRHYFEDQNLRFVVIRSVFSPLANPEWMGWVREAQVLVASSTHNVAWIDIDDLEVVCSHHLSFQSQLETGRRAALSYKKLTN